MSSQQRQPSGVNTYGRALTSPYATGQASISSASYVADSVFPQSTPSRTAATSPSSYAEMIRKQNPRTGGVTAPPIPPVNADQRILRQGQPATTPFPPHAESLSSAPTSHELNQTYSQKEQKLAHLRQRVMELRVGVEYEWQKSRDRLGHVNQSQAEFMMAMNGAMAQGTLDAVKYQLAALQKRAQDDFKELNSHSKHVKKLEAKLSRLEQRLTVKEADFAAATKNIILAIPSSYWLNWSSLQHRSTASDVPLPPTKAQPVTPEPEPQVVKSETASADGDSHRAPTALEEYYDHCGNIKLHKERLDELDVEYQDNLVQREILTEQDQPPTTPDEEFHYSYLSERQTVLEQLEVAINSAAHLKEICLAQGVDLNDKAKAPSVPDSAPDSARITPPLTPLDDDVRRRRFSNVIGLETINSSSNVASNGQINDSASSPHAQAPEDPTHNVVVDWLTSLDNSKLNSNVIPDRLEPTRSPSDRRRSSSDTPQVLAGQKQETRHRSRTDWMGRADVTPELLTQWKAQVSAPAGLP